jgi:Dolichyl-phosphate-mannose-protein mannosyltransferase
VAARPSTTASRLGAVISLGNVRARVAALPTWLLVAGVVAASFVYRLVYALRDPAPWMFTDELAYSELAKSFGTNGEFALRGVEGTGGFGLLYSILISPAYALFDAIPDAYDGIRVLNCLFMSAAAVPTYLVARRLAPRHLALLAAALAVALPSVMYSGNVMTENAFYPATALFILTLVRALERPTVVRQLVVFAAIGVAFLIRVQALTFVGILLAAIAVVSLLDALAARDGSAVRRLRVSAVRFWPTAAILALGGVAVVVRQELRGQQLRDILGGYAGVAQSNYTVAEVGHWFLYHVAEIDILLGVFPFAALIAVVLAGLRPTAEREHRIFAAVALPVAGTFLLVGAAYATDFGAERIVERNVFHLAPVAFIALAAWVSPGFPRPWWAVAPAALFAGSVTLALPLNSFFGGTIVHSTSGLVPIWRWRDRLFSPESIDEVVFLAAAAAALVFAGLPRRFGLVLPAVVLLFYAAANRPVEGFTHGASEGAYVSGVGSGPRDWVDRAVGRDADVATFWYTGTNPMPYFQAQFFNRSIDRAYTLTGPYDGLVTSFRHVAIRPSGVLFDAATQPVRERYVVTDSGTRLEGTVVGRNSAGMRVYEVTGPLTVRERLDGLYPDRWSGSSFFYQRYDCDPGTLKLGLESSPALHPRAFRVEVLQHGRLTEALRFRSREQYPSAAIDLVPRDGKCHVELRIPTGFAGASVAGDLRQLGLRFLSVRYVPR